MRKYFSLILAVMIVLAVAGYVSADVVYSRSPDARVSIYVATSTTVLAGDSSTTISSVNRILGFSYSNSAAGTVGLYDDTSIANMNTNTTTHLFAETTVSAGGVSVVMFPLPYQVNRGVMVHSSSRTGVTNIYYE